mmetsp:Transcript_59791/g.142331  ORF Transcript_59791/g.142331 Transcript_59791/m.142331 type:complete len:601 (-) Transcript_59791:172-1974(-)
MGCLQQQSIAVFRKFDSNGDGYISKQILCKVLLCLDPTLDAEEIVNVFIEDSQQQRRGGSESSPRINYAEFVAWLCRDDSAATRPAKSPKLSKDGLSMRVSGLPSSSYNGAYRSLDGLSIEYLTDVEGNWEYFLRFVALSGILYWEELQQNDFACNSALGTRRLSIRQGGILVFGGDATDKGIGDIRFVKTLLSLKGRFPNQIFIILGNRDIQPLRYFAELSATGVEHPFTPYWLREDKLVTYDAFLAKNGMPRSTLTMLQWMQIHNMGCPTTFETRKKELQLLLQDSAEASDDEVLASFRNSVDPQGEDPWMLELLRVGQLGCVLGDALFVHAGLHDESIGYLPGLEENSKPCTVDSVQEWVSRLNDWKDSQLRDFEAQPAWSVAEDGKSRRRGAAKLLDYSVPGGANNGSVAYHNPFAKADGNPEPLSEFVQTVLQRSGIRRLFTGHQPHGQSPSVVRHPLTGLVALSCDTSYSDMQAPKEGNVADNRGKAVSIVAITAGVVHIRGLLADGSSHECIVRSDPEEDSLPDCLVGRQLRDGAWIKTVLHGPVQSIDEKVQAVFAKGRELEVTNLSVGDASSQLTGVHGDAVKKCLEGSRT